MVMMLVGGVVLVVDGILVYCTNPTEQEIFVPTGTLVAVKLLN
jgi:hypothetical protein